MSSGNFAVVFKMVDTKDNKHYAMKCFLRDQVGREESYIQICAELEFVESRYLLKTSYLPGELFVDTSQSDETEFPVLLMEWVEGCTLGVYIADNYADSFKISQLAFNFSKMASWLLSQDFAHGDIKPDNIIVKDNGNLVLVDYDGMYVPSMKGSIARENGSPNFRHPKRTETDFDEHIDDFALAVLNLTLKVLSLNFDSISTIINNDYCIFNDSDYLDLNNAVGLDYIEFSFKDAELQKIWGIFLIALSEKNLSSISFRLPSLALPSKEGNYSVLTELTDDETKRKEEDGIVVDRSGKRLIAANFSNDVLTIPEGIEVICRTALQRSKYKKIVLSGSIKAIGGIAFANSQNLESINIPRHVVFLEHSNPFGGCINLKDIQVDSPNYIIHNDCLYSNDHQILYASLFSGDDRIVKVHPDTTMISGNAFWQREVEEIVLPDYLTVISGSGAFGFCKKLKHISIPESVVEIGAGSFLYCSSLESIVIPDSVIKLGPKVQKDHTRGMFQNCEKLKEATLPNKIAFIGDSFFRGCKSLEHITIPDQVQEIGAHVFDSCHALKEIVIPSSVKIIRNGAFRRCESIQSIYIPDSVALFGVKDPESTATKRGINDIIEFLAFGGGMFSSCSALTDVKLPQGLDKIREDDFKRCTSLTHITIPNTVTEIEKEGFSYCKSLLSVQLPKQLRVIHHKAFAYCTELEQVSLPNGLVSLQNRSFEGCSNLKTINLPSTLTHLDGNPFPGCSYLDVKVNSDAFTVTKDSLFSFDKRIIHAYWGDKDCGTDVLSGVNCIDSYCFSQSQLESIIIPSSINTIKEYAFSHCERLQLVSLGDVSELSRYLFNDCKALEYMSIPSSVTKLGEGAFDGCSALIDIDIPSSILNLEDNVFRGCTSLSYIELPKSLKGISRKTSKRGVFANCKSLSEIKLNSYIPSLQEFDFKGCESLKRIIVPEGDKNRYRQNLGLLFQLIVEGSE